MREAFNGTLSQGRARRLDAEELRVAPFSVAAPAHNAPPEGDRAASREVYRDHEHGIECT